MPTSDQARRRQWRRLLYLAIGAALFGLILYVGGRPALAQVGNPDPLPFLLGLLATAAMFAASSGRWAHITNALVGRRVIGHLESFAYFMSSFLVGVLVSQSVSTVVVRSAALNKAQDVSAARSVGSVFFDKLLDLFFILLFAVPALPFFLGWISLPLALVLSIVAAILALLLAATQGGRIEQWLQRLWAFLVGAAEPSPTTPQGPMARALARFLRSGLGLRLAMWIRGRTLAAAPVPGEVADGDGGALPLGTLLTPSALVAFCLYSVAKQVLLALRLFFIAQAVGVDVGLGLLFLGVPFAQLSLLVAFTPGALGILELGWFAVFTVAGIDPAATAAFVIAQRAYNVVYVIILSALSYASLWLARLLSPHRR